MCFCELVGCKYLKKDYINQVAICEYSNDINTVAIFYGSSNLLLTDVINVYFQKGSELSLTDSFRNAFETECPHYNTIKEIAKMENI